MQLFPAGVPFAMFNGVKNDKYCKVGKVQTTAQLVLNC